MTDPRASFEGPPHARQSPEALSDHGEGDLASGAQPTSSVPRRRPLRTRTASDDSQPTSPTWADTDKGDSSRKARGGRATPRKSSKLSPQSDAKLDSSVPSENAAVGFFPKLSRILEGKENKAPRRQPSSTVGSEEDHTLPRRRHQPAEDATLSRRAIRQKHGSLQRRVESLVNLPNPSLMSVLSGVTQQSNVSSGSNESNSTITQQSYNRSHIVKHKPTRVRKRMQAKKGPPQGKSDTMDAQQSGVFRYMSESLSSEQFRDSEPHASRPSTASSTSSVTSLETEDDDLSSNGNEEGLVVDSRVTSPGSMRRPYREGSDDDAGESGSGMSVREASPDSHRQPSVSDDVEDSDEAEKDPNQGGEVEAEHGEYGEDDGKDDGEGNASATDEVEHQQHHAHHMALERVPPPRIPSASSSRHSDRHTRRLRRQEQALNEHVLQAPKPHRDFQFIGGPSPQTLPPHPAIPMYDPYVHSDASPANFYTTAHHAPPPVPPPVPPPPIGYYSPPHAPPGPYSPGYENNAAISTRPPMAAPSAMVSAPPFPYPAPPPNYQPHPTVPDLSRPTVVGYELLADKLCEGSKVERRHPNQEIVVPMYRKFEQLNHRVLLHLQDEISELEEELRQLDECIAQCSPRDGAGLIQPASRRGDARYGSDLHFRRTELLGRIYLKLGQYNAALTSFNNMVKNVDAADTEDIRAYRSWIEKRTPIDYAETRFLKHSADLLAVSRSKSASIASGVPSHQSAAMFLPLILVLPLMAFAIVPGLLGRLFVLVVISGGIIKLIMSTKELMELMTAREWSVCFSGYFGLMVVLAALVH